jgi:hypothetical protein
MQAVEKFLANPAALYAERFEHETFRNLPGGLFYFFPFYGITSEGKLNLLVYSSCTLFWNLITCMCLKKIATTPRWKELSRNTWISNPWLIMGIYLLCPLHVGEYAIGQTNVIAGFFILLSCYFFLNEKDHYAFACLSASLYFKMTGLFLLLLVFFISKKENFLKNLFYIIVVQGPNITLFASFPNYITDFIALNVSTGEADAVWFRGFGTGSSGTLSLFLMHNFGISLLWGTLVILILMALITLITLIKRRLSLTIIDQFMLLILLFAIAVPTFYLIHVFIYLGVFLLWLVVKDTRGVLRLKWLLLFPSFSIFFWFFFPFIPFLYLLPFGTILIKAWRGSVQGDQIKSVQSRQVPP